MRAPRSKAALACSAVASVWPHETATPRACSSVDQLVARRAARARASRAAPARLRAAARAARGRGRGARPSGCVPSAPRREERPFDVDAEDPRPVARPSRHLRERREQLLLGRRDERGQVRGDAGLEQRLAGAPVAVGVGVEEVDAGEAVDLQVDEAGRRRCRGRSRRRGRTRRCARRRSRRRRGRARRRRARLRRRASSARAPRGRCRRRGLEPRARARRRRRPASSDDDRDLRARRPRPRAPPRPRSRGAPVAVCTMRRDAGAQLLVRGDDVDHQVVERLAEPDHRDGRDRVEHELLRRARLQPRRAGEELGADDDADLAVGERAPSSEPGARHDARRAARPPPRRLERAERVRRPAARADRRRPRRPRRRRAPATSRRARRGVVLGRLLLERRSVRRRRRPRRRPGRARSENVASHSAASTRREPAGRAGADVDEPAAAPAGARRLVDPRPRRRPRPRTPRPPARRRPAAFMSSTSSAVERRSRSRPPCASRLP